MRCAERHLVVAAALAAALGCGGGGGGGGGGGTLPSTTRNVVPISVDGKLCGLDTAGTGFVNQVYVNEPCVAVKVCTPGSQTECQTIDGILLDTGSYGLRLFKQVLTTAAPTPVTSGGGELAECVQYGDQSANWGPVRLASVVLGGEPAVKVPIHVIDATYGTVPASCTGTLDTDPVKAGFNGILGVGVFAEDCGAGCVCTSASCSSPPPQYFSCSGTSCAATFVSLANQVTNPLAALPQDNNGLVVSLPAVPAGGGAAGGAVEGTLYLGIGTAQNNVPGAVTTLDVDPRSGEFRTTLAGNTTVAFADTGSNALFFSPTGTSLTNCPAPNQMWFCSTPQGTETTLTATTLGASRGSKAVTFQVGDFAAINASPNAVFADLAGGAISVGGFDWGLPFFFGRPVYVGLEGRASSLGDGPLVAH